MTRTSSLPGLVALAAALAGGLPGGGAAAQAAEGARLAGSLGCGGCHEGLPEPEAMEGVPAFGAGAPVVTAEFVFTYLADPVPRRPELAPARMPDFGLDEVERLALAVFLAGDAEGPQVGAAAARSPGVGAAEGAALFDGLGCAGCHAHSDVPGESATGIGPDLGRAGWRLREEWVGPFLADPVTVRPAGHRPGTGSRMPDFRLESDEVEALAAYLGTLRSGPAPAALTTAAGGEVPDPEPLTPWGRQRAESYLTDRLSCLGCHSWKGEGGRVAPPLDGLPERLTTEAIAAAVHAPTRARPGSVMPPSPFQRGILDEVVALLAGDPAPWQPAERTEAPWAERLGILAAWAPIAGPGAGAGGTVGASGRAGSASAASSLYGRRCAACHGVNGDGGGFNAPWLPVAPTAHADPAGMSLRPDDTLYDGIAAGGWVLDRSHRMPAFKNALDGETIRSLVAYIRALCDCQGPSWATGEGAS